MSPVSFLELTTMLDKNSTQAEPMIVCMPPPVKNVDTVPTTPTVPITYTIVEDSPTKKIVKNK